MTAIKQETLGEIFVEIADTLVDHFDLVEFLQTLTTRAAELTGTHAAGVLLGDERDRLHFMAASDERVDLLELFQISIDEGPCVDCFRHGSAVVNADLRQGQTRWLAFAPRAVTAGFTSVHAFPLRLRKRVIGAMGLFSAEPVRLVPADARIVQALADVATIAILQERAIRHGEELTAQLQGALNTRLAIEQAKGVLAEKYGITVDVAFALLRDYCRRNGLRLSEVALLIVHDPEKAPVLRDA